MSGRKKVGGSKRRPDYERFADAVVEGLKPSFEGIRSELVGIHATLDEHGKKLDDHNRKLDEHGRKLDDHGKKLDQLISGAVGVGRIYALEERVTALEQRR